MKLCFHDWYIHKTFGPMSFRYWSLISLDGPVAVVIIAVGLAIGVSTSIILHNLFGWDLGNHLVGLLATLVAVSIYIFTAAFYGGAEYDPWRPTDMACLKCDTMKFNATKAARKDKLTKTRCAELDKVADKKAGEASKIRKQKIIESRKSYSKMLLHYNQGK